MHQHDIDGHSVDRRRKSRLSAKLGQAPKNLKEDLLQNILGIVRRTEHSHDETGDIPLMTPEQFRECSSITAVEAIDQPRVFSPPVAESVVRFAHATNQPQSRPVSGTRAGSIR